MRRMPGRQERLVGLFVVVGSTLVFAPLVWLLQRWSEAVARDPADAWGVRWLGEQMSAHPYLTGGALLLCVALSSGVVMLIILRVAKRLAARLTGGGQSPTPRGREKNSGT
jgi:hypothetical protein